MTPIDSSKSTGKSESSQEVIPSESFWQSLIGIAKDLDARGRFIIVAMVLISSLIIGALIWLLILLKAQEGEERKRAAEQRRPSEQILVEKKSTKNERIEKTNTFQGSIPKDFIILPRLSDEKTQWFFYKAQGSVCQKITALSRPFHEDIAKRYKSSVGAVRLVRIEASFGGGSHCEAIVDTAHGPISCTIGSIVNKKGSGTWLATNAWETQSGTYVNPWSCSPHPEVFFRR